MISVVLTAQQRRMAMTALLAFAALMALDVGYQLVVHIAWRHWMPSSTTAIAATTQPTSSPATSSAPAESPPKELHAAIRHRNIFVAYQPRQHGLALSGVLGHTALFRRGDQTIGIDLGASDNGVKVVAIEGYKVTIEFAGKKETLELFTACGGRGGEGRMRTSKPETPAGHTEKVETHAGSAVPTQPSHEEGETPEKSATTAEESTPEPESSAEHDEGNNSQDEVIGVESENFTVE